MNRIKEYYKNSPKRIGWTWFAVHLFFLMVAFIGFQTPSWEFSNFRILPLFAYLFPVLPITMISSFINPNFFMDEIVFLFGAVYYILFFFMLFKAKDTSSKKFIIISRIFLVWFLLALICSFIILFNLVLADMTL
ncbi:MAG: hypothetical protein WC070_04495 [Candidatus Magasanikbacteria bacterium]